MISRSHCMLNLRRRTHKRSGFGLSFHAILSGRAAIEFVVKAATSYELCICSVGFRAETPFAFELPTGVKYLLALLKLRSICQR